MLLLREVMVRCRNNILVIITSSSGSRTVFCQMCKKWSIFAFLRHSLSTIIKYLQMRVRNFGIFGTFLMLHFLADFFNRGESGKMLFLRAKCYVSIF